VADVFGNRSLAEVRAYWDQRPCNIRHSPSPRGTKQYFDEVEQRKYFVEPHIPVFADFPAWAGKRVLEVGCGIGTDTMNFARAGAEVTAVDLSTESLAVARQRAEVFGLESRIRFVEANAENLADSVSVEPYDLVYSFGVLHHTPDPPAALRSIRAFVGPNSTFKLMMYHRRSWKVFWLLCTEGHLRFWDLDRIIAQSSEAQTGCPVTYSYSRRSLAALLSETGFEARQIFVDHIFPYRIPEYLKYEYKRVWYFDALPEPVFRFLERKAGWHLCATAVSR